jgi:hypothetical protein
MANLLLKNDEKTIKNEASNLFYNAKIYVLRSLHY